MRPCPHCAEPHGTASHVRWCLKNPKRPLYEAKLRQAQAAKRGKKGGNQFTSGSARSLPEETRAKIAAANTGRKHTAETCQKISAVRLKWLQENPDKHPWKSRDKFRSVPCEKLKEQLGRLGIPFEAEYQPFVDRFFALDIAFPGAMLAVEVNGNQHYADLKTGKLKRYYQNRHDLLVAAGWDVMEIRYNACFNGDALTAVLEALRLRNSGDRVPAF